MSIFLILGLVVAALIVLLRLKRSLGFSVLCSGLLIWLLLKPEPHLLTDGVVSMLQRSRTYDLVGHSTLSSVWKLNFGKADVLTVWSSTSSSSPRQRN